MELRAGDEAFERMIVANLRLVVSIAKRYQNRSKSLDVLDLIQEGTLISAAPVQKLDHTSWIQVLHLCDMVDSSSHHEGNIADKGRTVRMPVHVVESINEIENAKKYLEVTMGRVPRLDEVADYLEMPPGKVQALLDIARDPISLDAPILRSSGDEEGGDLEDFIDMPSVFGDPAEVSDRFFVNESVLASLSELTPREKSIIELRFGLESNEVHTLEEIGTMFGVTRERIRQIESKALKLLKYDKNLRALHQELWPPRSEPAKKAKQKVSS